MTYKVDQFAAIHERKEGELYVDCNMVRAIALKWDGSANSHDALAGQLAQALLDKGRRIEELEVKAKKTEWMHKYEVKEWQAREAKLTRLVEILVENDPNDMAADAVTVLDVWRKEASEILARHARLDARQAGMEKMRADQSDEIRAAVLAAWEKANDRQT
jgi:hypothetical protein